MVRLPICGDKVAFQNGLGSVYKEIIAFWCNEPTGEPEPLGGKLTSKDDRFRIASESYTYTELDDLPWSVDGKYPLERLDSSKVRPLENGIRNHLVSYLKKPIASVDTMTISVWDIIKSFHDMGYDMWVSGGAIRDFLRGSSTVNDIDLAGTVPPGMFAEVTYRLIRDFDLDLGMNPPAAVIYVYDRQKPRGSKDRRTLEYAPLKYQYVEISKRYEFDHDVERDSTHRDLTINSLFCDIFKGIVIDPTGKGLDDLSTLKLRLISPLPANCPKGTLASRVLRLLKFAIRWPDADLVQIEDFFKTYSEAFAADLDALGAYQRLKLVAKNFFGAGELGDQKKLRQACSKLGFYHIYERYFDPLWRNQDEQ